MTTPCVRCNFSTDFIIDYNEWGEEYTFCGNCGTVKEAEDENHNPRDITKPERNGKQE